jgi:hypothetical protein
LTFLKSSSRDCFLSGNPTKNILESIREFQWNSYITPPIFLNKLEGWLNGYKGKFEATPPDFIEIVRGVFEILVPSSSERLKVWMEYDEILADYFDYYKFAVPYKQLSRVEKKRLREIIDSYLIEILEEDDLEVESCHDFITIEEVGDKEYTANFSNFYFSNGEVRLKLEDETFTKPYELRMATNALNRVSSECEIFKENFLVIVGEKKEIKEIEGLEKELPKLYLEQIEAFPNERRRGIIAPGENGPGYSVDIYLKKEVKEYLEQKQLKSISVRALKEAVPFYKKKLEGASYSGQTCQVFTFQQEEAFIFIWESLDFILSNSTFLFKYDGNSPKDHLERIVEAITKISRLRTILKKDFTKDLQDLVETQEKLQSYLGYIGNITKRRGRENEFRNWKNKFEEIDSLSAPAAYL